MLSWAIAVNIIAKLVSNRLGRQATGTLQELFKGSTSTVLESFWNYPKGKWTLVEHIWNHQKIPYLSELKLTDWIKVDAVWINVEKDADGLRPFFLLMNRTQSFWWTGRRARPRQWKFVIREFLIILAEILEKFSEFAPKRTQNDWNVQKSPQKCAES